MDRIPADAMVVVADGESARVFRNVGADGVLSLQQQELLTAKQLGDDSASGAAPTEQSPKERSTQHTSSPSVRPASAPSVRSSNGG